MPASFFVEFFLSFEGKLMKRTGLVIASALTLSLLPWGSNLNVNAYPGGKTVLAGDGFAGDFGDGGLAVNAQLNNPSAISIDNFGNIYFGEFDGESTKIRKIDTDGIISTFSSTPLYRPPVKAMAIDKDRNIYIATTWNIRKIAQDGTETFFAGSGSSGELLLEGPATDISIDGPGGLAFDPSGNLFITQGNLIRKVDPSGYLTTIAGTGESGFSGDDGPATTAQFQGASGIGIDSNGNIIVADTANHRVRKIDSSGTVTTIAGTGVVGNSGDGDQATNARLTSPGLLQVGADDKIYFRSGSGIRRINGDGTICSIQTSIGEPISNFFLSPENDLYVTTLTNKLLKIEGIDCGESRTAQFLKDNDNFDLFYELVRFGGWLPTLSDCDFTRSVFAPNDQAMQEILDELDLTIEDFETRSSLANAIVTDHVVGTRITPAGIENDQTTRLTAGSGLLLKITQDPPGSPGSRKIGENLYVNGEKILSATELCGGTVFEVDGVIGSGPTFPQPSNNLTWNAPSSPTTSRYLLYQLDFSQPVKGLTASQITNTGTATPCATSIVRASVVSEYSTRYFLTALCSSSGTYTPEFNVESLPTSSGSLRFRSSKTGPTVQIVPGRILSVSKTGNGSGTVTSSPSGIDCGSQCSSAFETGAQVTLTAVAAPGSTFIGWTGACRGTGTCTVRMSANQAVTAEFRSTGALVVSRIGTGSGTVSSRTSRVSCTGDTGQSCISWLPTSTVVTLTATPSRGSRFIGWMGACTGIAPCVVTIQGGENGNHVFAIFER